MAHFWKYKLNDVKGVMNEALRTTKEDGEFKVKALRDGHIIGEVEDNVIFRHKDFDSLFSEIKKGKFQEEDTIEEGRIKTHATKVLGGVLITLPKEYKEESRERQDQFFKECDKMLTQQFGEQFCVFSGVHYDETTPHLHFYFIPAEHREQTTTKTGRVREGGDYLSAKSVMSHDLLVAFHDRLDKHLKDNLEWYHGGVLLPPEERSPESNTSKDYKNLKEATEKKAEELRELSTALAQVNQMRSEIEKHSISEADLKRVERGKVPKNAKSAAKIIKEAGKRMEEAQELMKSAAEKSVALDYRIVQLDRDRVQLEEREKSIKEREENLLPTEIKQQALQDSLILRERDLKPREEQLDKRERDLNEREETISRRERVNNQRVKGFFQYAEKIFNWALDCICSIGDSFKATKPFKGAVDIQVKVDRKDRADYLMNASQAQELAKRKAQKKRIYKDTGHSIVD